MKWYCIKKYAPQTDTEMMIRALNPDEYERYFIAKLDLLDSREKLINWELSHGSRNDSDIKKYTVTHFCPIDPVEEEL